jgi:hypothetical protein
MASDLNPRPTLVLNPPDDPRFRSLAVGFQEDGAGSPATLEAQLRREYPHAIVRRRELVGEQTLIWYVYRDGRWVRPGRHDIARFEGNHR